MLYDYDSNTIAVQPLKTRQGAEITRKWMDLHQIFLKRGISPETYVMDNEVSQDLKKSLLNYNVKYQLTPPNMYRINAAERAIRTFKNHFLAGLSTLDPSYPIAEWDRLIPQATITLNLLRNARANPKLSAYAYVYGQFDFNRTPMAPPGTKIVIHDKPAQRTSWQYHGTNGFYIAPAMEHYRCMKCHVPLTRQERVADTIQFFPHKIDFPALSINDHLLNAPDTITSLLTHQNNPNSKQLLQLSPTN